MVLDLRDYRYGAGIISQQKPVKNCAHQRCPDDQHQIYGQHFQYAYGQFQQISFKGLLRPPVTEIYDKDREKPECSLRDFPGAHAQQTAGYELSVPDAIPGYENRQFRAIEQELITSIQ